MSRSGAVALEVAPRDPLVNPGRSRFALHVETATSVPNHLVDMYRLVEALDLDKSLVLELKALAQA